MVDILTLLDSTNPEEALNNIDSNTTLNVRIKALRKEFNEIDRSDRATQIGRVQQDKYIGKGASKKRVDAVRIPIPFQNKIVKTATAFEVGEPPTLIPFISDSSVKENKITKEMTRLFKVNRINHQLQVAIELKKSELQCAMLFYIKKTESGNSFNKLIGINSKKEIKTDLLKNENGVMTPIYDGSGDMKAFVWEFTTDEALSKVKHTWIYTDAKVYKFSDATDTMKLVTKDDHGFNKIPIVYFSQQYPEWHVSEQMIDRIEVALSKLAASNDYSGHPMLMLYGEVHGAPDKDEDGKALRFNMKLDEESGKVSHGDAKFLTHDDAPESVRMELERLEKYIYSLTSTPDLSLENLKGIGDISGKAIRLMFMDAIIKSKMNEGVNRTAIERIINVFISGILTTTGTNLKQEANNTFFDIKFNSILPSEINEDIVTYGQAVNSKIMSKRTAIKSIGMAEDVEKEWEQIQEETKMELAEEKANEPIKQEPMQEQENTEL